MIFTTLIPSQSADFESSHVYVQDVVKKMLSSGKAVFIKDPTAETLASVLENVNLDVRFTPSTQPFNYIHKIVDDGHLYYFGNIDDKPSRCDITFEAKLEDCLLLDPHTGEVKSAQTTSTNGAIGLTIELNPGQSVFLVENKLFSSMN